MTEFVLTDELQATVTVGGMPYLVTDLSVETTQYNETDMAEATVVADRHAFEPNEGNEATVSINDTLVFTGFCSDVDNNADGSYKVKLFNGIHLLKTGRVDLSLDQQMPASEVLRDVFQQCEIDNFEINLASPVESQLASKFGFSGSYDAPVDNEITLDRTNAPGDSVLESICDLTNASWWVDIDGTIMVGRPEYRYLGELTYITSASDGKFTPAYQSVKVIGDNVVSAGGWSKRNLVSKETAVATRSLRNIGVPREDRAEVAQSIKVDYAIEEGLLNKPTFTYKNKDIKTQGHAESVANRLTSRLVKQSRQGHVEVVGRPDIRVCDTFKMPDELGGVVYQVSGVEHRVSGTNGFTTKIYVGGVVGN